MTPRARCRRRAIWHGLASALIRDFPEYYPWFALKEFTYNGLTQYNRNALLWRDGAVDGVKTGQTHAAGFCLAASASHDGMRLIAVALGARNENARVASGRRRDARRKE